MAIYRRREDNWQAQITDRRRNRWFGVNVPRAPRPAELGTILFLWLPTLTRPGRDLGLSRTVPCVHAIIQTTKTSIGRCSYRRQPAGELLIANSFDLTFSFRFFPDCWNEQGLDLSCWPDACSTTLREKSSVRPRQYLLVSFFPFHDRAMTSEVRHERTSFCTRVYSSKLSADREIESLKKINVRAPQVINTSGRWNNSASTVSRKTNVWSRWASAARHWEFPNSPLSENCQRSRNVVNDNQPS